MPAGAADVHQPSDSEDHEKKHDPISTNEHSMLSVVNCQLIPARPSCGELAAFNKVPARIRAIRARTSPAFARTVARM
jgi:hypothetical protein